MLLFMTEAIFKKEVMQTLNSIKRDVSSLRKDVELIKEQIDDIKLYSREKRNLNKSIKKIRSGDNSDFVSWEKAKKEIEV